MGGDRWAELRFWVYSGRGLAFGGSDSVEPRKLAFESLDLRDCCTRVVYVD